jgi:peroxiredoxin
MKRYLFLIAMGCLASITASAAFINEQAPDFSLKNGAGENVTLAQFRGDVVFVNFWASWCPPCKQEFPELSELANEYKGQEVHVLAISVDKSIERVQKFIEKSKLTPRALMVLHDHKSEVIAQYGARSMPSSFIIDKKGVIRFVHFGFNEKDPAKWRAEINTLREEK